MPFIVVFLSCEEVIIEPPKDVIVFCDLSPSLDSTSILSETKKIKALYKSLPYNSSIAIYPINDRMYPEPIFTGTIPPHSKFNSDNKKNDSIIMKRGDELTNAIHEEYFTMNAAKDTEYKSCIITSLETAINIISKRSNKNRLHLFLFSDMIEQCPNSRAGSMYMCSSSKAVEKQTLLDQISEKFNPEPYLNLRKLIDNRVNIIISSNKKEEQRCLQDFEIRELWKVVFSRIGYSETDFNSFHFNQELPPSWIKKIQT